MFREHWCCDFEFQHPNDDQSNVPVPVCMTARELRSRREVRVFQDELRTMTAAPFDVGADSCLVAYAAGAEASCFAALGWEPPHNVLDLYSEHLRDMNGRPRRRGDGAMLYALERHGIPAMPAIHKQAMRDLVRLQTTWSDEEREAILSYCMEDAEACEALLRAMEARGLIHWPQALWRGDYMFASGYIEHVAIPVDIARYHRIKERFGFLRHELITQGDRFGIYVNDRFNHARLAALATSLGISWPRLPTGVLRTDGETWKALATRYPVLASLRSLVAILDQLRDTTLAIGSDGRNRFWTRPLLSRTGRNQPSTSENILGNAAWWRGLISPPEGFALAVIDYSAQENAIAAGQSGDAVMRHAYETGDIHMQTAILVGLAPPGATEETHPAERDQVKPISHGSNYGISAHGVSANLGISRREAQSLLTVLIASSAAGRPMWSITPT
jgi:hypothetical protein